MTESPIPYLASVRWYAAYVSALLEGKERAPRLPAHFNRTEVLAPFGLRQLSVPIEGGRRIISPRRYEELQLSEHGGWRHTHWQTITSAYGSAPYFHYMEDRFRAIYERRYDLLGTLRRAGIGKIADGLAVLANDVDDLVVVLVRQTVGLNPDHVGIPNQIRIG